MGPSQQSLTDGRGGCVSGKALEWTGFSQNRRHGFSLLEVLAVVVIIVMVAATIGVRFYKSLDSAALRSSSHRLLQTARYARLTAGENHQPCTLEIDLDRGLYWLRGHGKPAQPGMGPSSRPSASEGAAALDTEPRRLPETVRIIRAQVAGKGLYTQGKVAIEFHVDGSAEAALVQLNSAERTWTLLVQPWTAQAELKAGAVDTLPVGTVDLSKAAPSDRPVP